MKVYTGSVWVDAYAAGSSFLAKANNLSDLTNTSTARTNLGLAIGTNVQAYDAQLADVAGLTPTDNGVIIGNGTNFVVESGSTLRTSLGLAIGTDVQAYDADLATIAGLTPTNNYAIIGNGTSWTSSALPASGVTSVTGTSPIASSGGSTPAISLNNSGVTANTYGSSTALPIITVTEKGLITGVTTASVSSVPSQTGNSGKYLTTDGSTASWATVAGSAVLQVIQPAVYTTPFSTTSGTATSTGFTATITPTSASSKILIIAYSTLGVPTTGMNGHIELRRGTSTTIASDFYVTYGAADYLNAAFTGVYLDSPSTTSATTYYLYAYRDGAAGTIYVGARRDGGSPVTTSITLMEIAG